MVSEIPTVPVNLQTKPITPKKCKYKRNAMEQVDMEEEYRKDPRYKTEICSSYSDTGFCQYGNKCRFAHGKSELFGKSVDHPKFRKSDCLTFHSDGYCKYGQRCHFKHNQYLKVERLHRSYYSLLLLTYPVSSKNKHSSKRLNAFKNVTHGPTRMSMINQAQTHFRNYQPSPLNPFITKNQNIAFYMKFISMASTQFNNIKKAVNGENLNFNTQPQTYRPTPQTISTSCSENVSPINSFIAGKNKIIDNFKLVQEYPSTN